MQHLERTRTCSKKRKEASGDLKKDNRVQKRRGTVTTVAHT